MSIDQKLAKTKLYLGKHGPTILTLCGIGGVVATMLATIKSTKEADQIIVEAECMKHDTLTATEAIQVSWKCYISSIIIAGGTIACIAGSDMLNKRKQASLTAAYIFLERSFKNYKNQSGRVVVSSEEVSVKDADDNKHLFYIDHHGQFFERTMLEVVDAEYQLNRKFTIEGSCCLNDFFELLGLPRNGIGGIIGWGASPLPNQVDTCWIDFDHIWATTDDGLECYIIAMRQEPTVDYLPF